MILRYTFLVLFSFLAGWIMRWQMQDMYDLEAKQALGRQAYQCSGYLVATKEGNHECRDLQPRFIAVWPIPGDPVRLRRKEIRRAVGGNYKEQ